jgi:hypothetical protein
MANIEEQMRLRIQQQQQPHDSSTPLHRQPQPQPQTDEDQTKFVLYVRPDCRPSQRIIEMLHSFNVPYDDFWIQDVHLLGKRPLWLNGTPILADKKLRVIFPGNDAFVFLQSYLQNKQQDNQKTKGNNNNNRQSSLFQLPEEPDFKEPQTKGPVINEMSLADLMAAREAQIPTAKQPT